ncbi:SusC/RagA family TonB-linked outer membrane protein [Terrimonas pollutisoli]|uniref:SusC/RagA family TonB-linked outer membrane protein n=1 Tax=Terrimonas pollutisoli TaxID=3034147 RepID=UPI0023ECC5D2|nr:TonB-dependent receptor [Terrimonas sp. H1YJ31]
MKKMLLLLGWLFTVLISQAQTREVSGQVTDEEGKPLRGVTVLVTATKKGTQTDTNGNFKIDAPASGEVVLQITNTGFKPATVRTDGAAAVAVKLDKDVAALEDVVVIGYQSVKRKDLTGTVSSLPASQLEKIPVSSAAEALTGRLAGVQVTTVDGQPGAEVVIRVRGGGSITGSNDPLYIVDGFRVSSINDIAPTDIASIDILKDAATAAIYGAAGANGVVIITTKSAKGGKTTISYNGFMQSRNLPKKLDVLSPYEFVLAQHEFAKLRGQSEVDNLTKYFGAYDDLELYKYQQGTDWQEVLFGSAPLSQQHNLSITGGTDKTKMSLSVSNNKDEGLIPANAYQRNYLNFKLNHEISKSLKFDFASRFTHTVVDGNGTAGTSSLRIGDAITARPVNGIADQIVIDQGAGDDEYEQFLKSLINPLALAEQDWRKRTSRLLNMNAGLSWQIIKGLTYRSEFNLNHGTSIIKRYYGPLTTLSKNEGSNLPLGELTNNETHGYRWTNTLAYSRNFAERHDLSLLAGQEVLALNKGLTEYSRAIKFVDGTAPEKLFATMALGTTDKHTTTVLAGQKVASFFGQAIYQFDKKYIFNLTGRFDGSTQFAPGKQWGFFPAASFAWRMSNEEFMDNVAFVSDLKFRASYGAVGNNNIANDLWRTLFTPSVTRPIGFGDAPQPYYTYASTLLTNPDIRWETTITRNIGLDFGLFKNRLTGTLDFYKNTTKDLLVESLIPTTTGFSRQQQNIGQTSNKGIELALNVDVIRKKDLQINFNFNIGINRARIDKLDGVNEQAFSSNWAGTDLKTQDDYRLIVGQTIGLMYGYVTDGWYTADDFESYDATSKQYILKAGVPNDAGILGLPSGYFKSGTVRPGILKLKDLNGDTAITAADRQLIGSALPKHSGGFGFNIVYKGFDFSPFFNWMYGNDVYNTGKISFNMQYRTSYGNMLNTSSYDNRFHYTDANGEIVTDMAELSKMNANAKTWSPFSMGTASPVFHSSAVEDGSFLRLNNVTLGYSLPQKLISKAYMKKLRVYVTVYNAFLWTSYSGYDPEVSTTRSSGYSQLTPGVDYSAFPKSRTYTAGVNVTF